MILCDTNVLVGLVDEADELHADSQHDLLEMVRQPLLVTEPVLTEAIYLLTSAPLRERLFAYLSELPITVVTVPKPDEVLWETITWLRQYAEHAPDWADAQLAVLCGHNPRLRIWTYDSEFQTIWRRPDGSRIPLVGRRRG